VVSAAVAADTQKVAAPVVSTPPAPSAAPRAAARPVARAEATPASAGEAKLDAVRLVAGIPPRAGESQSEYLVRAERLQALYGEARTAFQGKDYTSAVRLFERLEKEQPGLLDVSARLAESREGLREWKRAIAEAALASAAAAEQRGDLVEAQKEYERALDADPASGAEDGLRRVRAQMKTLGDAAFKRAKTFDALGRTEDAIAQYERAVQLLAQDDVNRKAARQRLDVLRAGIIK
jgi:tetratricopeptide (TPR) repeat protein